ncbi:hypothetical protein SH467x_000173 [Pirellulaceae bacterium SH467]
MKVSWKSCSVVVGIGLIGSVGAVVYAQQPPVSRAPSGVLSTTQALETKAPLLQGAPPPMVPNFGWQASPAIPPGPVATVAPFSPVAGMGSVATVAHPSGMARFQPIAPKFELLVLEDDQFQIERLDGPPTPEQRESQQRVHEKLREADQMLRNEKGSDEEKGDAKRLIRSYFSAQFQNDLKVRKEQIQQLEEQLEKLKSIVEKRAEQMDKIVDLRMTLLENDSNGLGFPPAFHQIPQTDFVQPIPWMPAIPTTTPPSPAGSYPPNTYYPSSRYPTPTPSLSPNSIIGPGPNYPLPSSPSEPKSKPAKSLKDGV